ncbi:MAG TPA: hypothetical protein VMN36_01725 [Verrucomicrobiales bacterium]|nr:hypothetical protein [Verrucomicrobiales bacterium]
MTLYLGSFEITYEPLKMEALPAEVRDGLEELFELVRSEPARALVELEPLSAQFPKALSLANWRITCISRLGRGKEARKLAEKLTVENPEYFFGRLTLAEQCLNDMDLDEAGRALGEIKHPCAVCPGRKLFHISEILAYFHLCARYYLLRGEFTIAESFLEILQSIEPEAPVTMALAQNLEACREATSHFLAARDEVIQETGVYRPAAGRSQKGVASAG